MGNGRDRTAAVAFAIASAVLATAAPASAASTSGFTDPSAAAADQYSTVVVAAGASTHAGSAQAKVTASPQKGVTAKAKVCVAGRRLAIVLPTHMLAPGERIRSTTVVVTSNGRRLGVPVTKSHRRVNVSLTGLSGAHAIRITISVSTSRQRLLRRSSVIHTCAASSSSRSSSHFRVVRRSTRSIRGRRASYATRGTGGTLAMVGAALLAAIALIAAGRRGLRKLIAPR